MADQELSFVNCPSCGSLIPSTAIRCRMCGFDMSQARDAASEDEASAGRGRVKQKTLSLTKEEVEDMKQTPPDRRESDVQYPPDPKYPEPRFIEPKANEPRVIDQRGAGSKNNEHAEDRERDGGSGQPSYGSPSRPTSQQRNSERVQSAEEGGVEENRGFRFRGREKDSVYGDTSARPNVERHVGEREPSEKVQSERSSSAERGTDRSSERGNMERVNQGERNVPTDRPLERAPSSERSSSAPAQVQNRPEAIRPEPPRSREPERRDNDAQRERQGRQEFRNDSRPERREERTQERGSNQERSGERGPDRPDRNRDERNRNTEQPAIEQKNLGNQSQPAQNQAPGFQASREVSQPTSGTSNAGTAQQGSGRDPNSRPQRRSDEPNTPKTPPPNAGVQNAPKVNQGSTQANPQVVHESKEDKIALTMQGGLERNSGRLVGWFLHYQGKQAEPVEIYAGKFLVSGAKLRETDLVVKDSSLSTPHAIINSASEDLILLDLMSEKGTYVKRAGQGEFVKIVEQVTLGHGDWIRFGEYDILICLVPKFEP